MNENVLNALLEATKAYIKEPFYASCLTKILLKYIEFYSDDCSTIFKIKDALFLLNARFPNELGEVKKEFEGEINKYNLQERG